MIASLRARDADALAGLMARHDPTMTRLAMHYVRDYGTAQEVVQETWLAVIKGISNFEGRCSLKNWIYKILINLAKARGQRDARTLPFASFATGDEDDLDPFRSTRYRASNPHEHAPPWGPSPRAHRSLEDDLDERELADLIISEISALPISQRSVIYLRDVRGVTAEETCRMLKISDVAQRVRLHKARSRVRAAIAAKLDRQSSEESVWEEVDLAS